MPYIKEKDRREALRNEVTAQNAGELNYQIFYYVKHANSFMSNDLIKLKKFIEQFLGKKPNYQKYNDMTGALIRCAKEIERRIVGLNRTYYPNALIQLMNNYDEQIAKYEDLKIFENGDVE